MPVKSIAVLKTFFETGDRPTESQFGDLIDSFIHKTTGSVVIGKSVDAATGDVLIQFSDGDSIGFNVNPLESAEISFINGLQAALDAKVDKENGKGLSTNDFTNELRTKLENLQQVTLPTSYEIDFINGLQEALNSKANDDEVVKSVTFNGTPYLPDGSGNVTIEADGGAAQSYNLGFSPVFVNYQYFGKDVYGVLLQIPSPDAGTTNYLFDHNLDVDKYLRLEVWEDGLPASVLGERARQELSELVFNNAGVLDLSDNQVDARGYDFPANKLLYIEYTINEIITEGISADIVGVSTIGVDTNPS